MVSLEYGNQRMKLRIKYTGKQKEKRANIMQICDNQLAKVGIVRSLKSHHKNTMKWVQELFTSINTLCFPFYENIGLQ